MKSKLSLVILTAALLLPFAARGQQPQPAEPAGRPFLETGTWWNLYFAQENNPLQRNGGSIHSVKVVETDPTRPAWIKIAFPKTREEHFSMFGPAAAAQDRDDATQAAALSDWEQTISEWQEMWVNLDFVVRATPVEPAAPASRTAAPAGRDR